MSSIDRDRREQMTKENSGGGPVCVFTQDSGDGSDGTVSGNCPRHYSVHRHCLADGIPEGRYLGSPTFARI